MMVTNALTWAVAFFSCFSVGSSFQQNLILEGVSLPVNFSSSVNYFPALTAQSAQVTGKFFGNNSVYWARLTGMNKSDPTATAIFKEYLQNYVDLTIVPKLPSDYLYFGNNNNYENVPYVFKTNSFFMPSLRSGPNNTFEIDPFGKRGTTYFSQFTALLKSSVPRVKAIFDSKMNIVNLKVYNSSGTLIKGVTKEMAATLLLYQCSFFAQNIHTSAHIYHLVMSSAMDHATTNTSLNSWAKPYMFQIYFKYTQVESLVLATDGFLAGSAPNCSGYDTFNREKLLSLNKEMLTEWGTYKTADKFVKKFLLGNISQKSLCGSGIATALLKQVALISPYANAMEKEFRMDSNFKSITSSLKRYLQLTGDGVSSISSMRAWLELMSVTGIMHGSTFSMTRLCMTQSIVSVNSYQSDVFTPRDTRFMRILAGTVLGTHEEFYVFSDSLPATYPYNISAVLTEYDGQTAALKAQHQIEITKDPVVYNNYGWILSDHGPNFLDGKQLTLITYF